METEVLKDLIALVNEVAAEQATREYSGLNWYNEFAKRLDAVKMKLPIEQNVQVSDTTGDDSSTDDDK